MSLYSYSPPKIRKGLSGVLSTSFSKDLVSIQKFTGNHLICMLILCALAIRNSVPLISRRDLDRGMFFTLYVPHVSLQSPDSPRLQQIPLNGAEWPSENQAVHT